MPISINCACKINLFKYLSSHVRQSNSFAVFLLRGFSAVAHQQDSGKNILLEMSAELYILGHIS